MCFTQRDSLELWAVFTHCRNTSKVSVYPYILNSHSVLYDTTISLSVFLFSHFAAH